MSARHAMPATETPALTHQATMAAVAELFAQLASRAAVIDDIVQEALASENFSLLAGASTLCSHLGWVADAAVKACGGVQFRGDATEWLMWPSTRDAVASISGNPPLQAATARRGAQ